jgi:predicted GNAT family acetyltransferase
MIRRLTEQDRETVLAYLAHESAYTLFLLGGIRGYGLDNKLFQLWGTKNDDNNTFDYVLGRFHQFVTVYSRSKTVDTQEILRFLTEHLIEFHSLSGKESLVDPFTKFIHFNKEHRMFLAELKREDFIPCSDATVQIHKAMVQNANDIYRLWSSMPEFRDMLIPISRLVELLETDKGIVLFVRQNGQMVSSVTELDLGRIDYVCTMPDFRGRGYGSLLVSRLAEMIFAGEKSPTLEYETSEAGRIYKRLGFREIGRTAIFSK